MFASSFAACWIALYVAHQVADHWVQTPAQSAGKGTAGWPGRAACAAHVATYTAVAMVALVVTAWAVDLHLSAPHVAAGLVVSAASHYWADRRTTLRGLVSAMDRLGMRGKVDYYQAGGAYALDQSWHIGWLWAAALITAGGAA